MGDRGGLVLDKDFDMSLQSSQRWLARFCSRLAKQPFYHDPLIGASSLLGRIPLALSNCFIENFREWMERPCRDTLTGEDHTPCCEASEFPFEPKIFDRLIPRQFNRLKILVPKFLLEENCQSGTLCLSIQKSFFSKSESFCFWQVFGAGDR